MQKLITAILVTVVLVAFTLANTHLIAVSFVFGAPVQVPLIVVIGVTFVSGLILSGFYRLYRSVEARRRARAEKQALKKQPKEETAEGLSGGTAISKEKP